MSIVELKNKQSELIKELEQLSVTHKNSKYRRRGVEILEELKQIRVEAKKINVIL